MIFTIFSFLSSSQVITYRTILSYLSDVFEDEILYSRYLSSNEVGCGSNFIFLSKIKKLKWVFYYIIIHIMKAKITATLETSDHDGYCSGGECEYNVQTVSYIIEIPHEYKNYPQGKLINLDEYGIDWVKLLPEPDLNYDGSGYCDLSSKCNNHGLGIHDYKYTILSIELVC